MGRSDLDSSPFCSQALVKMKVTRTQLEEAAVLAITEILNRLPVISFRKKGGYQKPEWMNQVLRKMEDRELEVDKIDNKRSKQQYVRRAQQNALLIPRIEAWVKKNLKPKMRVWVKGAKDGVGYREVIQVESGSFKAHKLVMSEPKNPKFVRSKYIARKRPHEYNWIYSNYITDHYFNKVIAVDIKGKKTSINDLLK